MNSKRPRYSLRISLRTLFVLLTMFCVFIGWQSNVVHKRRAAIEELKTKRGFTVTTAEMWLRRNPPGAPLAKIPRIRTWLGDEPIQEIWYSWYPRPDPTEIDRLRRLFPEALIQEIPTEPCHPGCFPAGSLVETLQGPRPIESIAKGDMLIVAIPGGAPTTAPAQSIFVTENHLWEIQTEAGSLLTTQTQPLCLASLATKAAGDLQPGDVILQFRHGELCPAVVQQVRPTRRVERVFNVVLGGCELFVAGGFVVRSKPPAETSSQSQ